MITRCLFIKHCFFVVGALFLGMEWPPNGVVKAEVKAEPETVTSGYAEVVTSTNAKGELTYTVNSVAWMSDNKKIYRYYL